jgi:hypothetical protein
VGPIGHAGSLVVYAGDRLYGCFVMGRFSRWSSSWQALMVLAAVFAAGAAVDAVLGHRTSAIVSAALAVVIVRRAWPRRSE